VSGSTLYGTTVNGGAYGLGELFSVSVDGTAFKDLHDFGTGTGAPWSTLTLSGATLYGTVSGGGAFNDGSIFSIHTNGSGYTDLFDFVGGTDGSFPYGGLLLNGSTLYGTTDEGGAGGQGTVFAFSLATPEPGTLTLMVSTFLGAGFVCSRRRRTITAPQSPRSFPGG
jgi:uncharacterized repeat protein (TIGR03803 family)